MEKLNIAEILKDCPKGMELDCTMYDNVKLIDVDEREEIVFPIRVVREDGITELFTKYGQYIDSDFAKCVIYPKGKTTWEGFQRPFKDGDVIFTHANCLKVGVGNTWISIYKENRNGGVATYVDYAEDGDGYYSDLDGDKAFLCMEEDILRQRFATEEEKQKLFDAIKANGYKWNTETKTLEKLPKFKVGDRVKHISSYALGIIVEVDDKGYYIKYPKGYGICYISFTLEKDYELLPNKFDISTLKPFESRVLVRDFNDDTWLPAIFGVVVPKTNDNDLPFVVVGGNFFGQCIPYESNEHLLGTTNDCDEYYKTWE